MMFLDDDDDDDCSMFLYLFIMIILEIHQEFFFIFEKKLNKMNELS